MPIETFTKRELADRQLAAALALHESRGDPVLVITLAGAAEEILGKLVLLAGGRHAYDDIVHATCLMHQHVFGEPLSPKDAGARVNLARNELKHLNSTDDATVRLDLEDEAIALLERAITNVWRLDQHLTPAMEHFERRRRAT